MMSSVVTSRDGTSIGFERSGSGPALVLVHGTSVDRTSWAPVVPALERQFTVYAMDRRGRGLSGDAADYSLDREYEDIAAPVDSIGEPADVVGHSFGALVAMEAALLTSGVRRLILYEPLFRTSEPIYPAGHREQLQSMIDRGEREAVLGTFFRDDVGLSDPVLESMRSSPTWAAYMAAAHTIPRELAEGEDVLEPRRFAGLTIPVLLLAGEASAPELQAATEAAHRALPLSRVTVMAGQGHLAIRSASGLFAQLVVEYLVSPL